MRAGCKIQQRNLPPAGVWLPDMDLNHDKQIQSLLCYHYTIRQKRRQKVGGGFGL